MTDTYFVIGCSACNHLQVIRQDGADTVSCERCGATYDKQSRSKLAKADSREGAAAKRGDLLEAQWT